MDLPTAEELQEMTELIAGPNTAFIALSPDKKITVIDLVLKHHHNKILDGIDTRLSYIEEWFTKSRLFEGLPYK